MVDSSVLRPYPEESRFVTVLVAEVRGLNTLMEVGDPEGFRGRVKEIWSRLNAVIEEYGGFVVKHYGDEVQAVWGAPLDSENDTERAVSCGLALVKDLEAFRDTLENPYAGRLGLRAGLSTGQVLTMYLGPRQEYTAIGDPVNISKRMADNAEYGSVVIGQITYRAVRGVFRVRRLDLTDEQDKIKPVLGYLIEQKLEQPTRVRYASNESLETLMVGREEPVADLLDLFEALQVSADPFLGLLIGETGMGKSRMLMEYASLVEGMDPNVNFLSVRGLIEAEKSPFYLWKTLWKNRFGIRENMDPDIACERFLRGLLQIWGNRLGKYSAVEAAHVVGDLIGLSWKNSPYLKQLEGDPEVRTERAFNLTRELLVRMSESGPILLLVDDLHWVDKGSQALLESLLKPEADALPLFILATSRPDYTNRNFRWLNLAYKVVRLEPVAFTVQLVRDAYPAVKPFPDALLARMIDRSEGLPLYMEEIVKSILQVDEESSAPRTGSPSIAHPIPENLRMLLQSRLDALPREAREVLQLASITGRIFWTGSILAAAKQPVGTGLLNLPPEVLDRVIQNALRQVVRAELAFPRMDSIYEGEQEYIFKNQMLQEVAYDSLPEKYRKFYHFAVAKWLAERASPDFNVLIAQHYEKAGNTSSALRHYQYAMDYADNRGASSETEWIEGHIRNIRREEGE